MRLTRLLLCCLKHFQQSHTSHKFRLLDWMVCYSHSTRKGTNNPLHPSNQMYWHGYTTQGITRELSAQELQNCPCVSSTNAWCCVCSHYLFCHFDCTRKQKRDDMQLHACSYKTNGGNSTS